MPKVGILFSGCGVMDGTEIHEAVLTMLFLDQQGAEMVFMAPGTIQADTINHTNGTPAGESRNVLEESARITRGDIKNVRDVPADEIDALILPGGAGAVKNLSDFAVKGHEADVDSDVQKLITDMHTKGKPIGAICISPAVVACALKKHRPEVTIGNDAASAAAIEKMGGHHIEKNVGEIHFDAENIIVTTPAYMLGPGMKDIAGGIQRLVNKILELC